MPSSNIKINPEALEIYHKIKSGEYLRLLLNKIRPLKWYFIGATILIFLLTAISVGRSLSSKTTQKITPPVIDITTPTSVPQKTSVFGQLKRNIQSFSTALPDPAIPLFDNNISL